MFESLSRSWEFAKLSYGLMWENKHLILFPVISTVSAALVFASFALPLWQSGQIEEWQAFMDGDPAAREDSAFYLVAFAFYFCNYFVILFFNTALVACALKIINGDAAPVSYGLSFAVKRLPQILSWALLSAVVGVILKMIERMNEKVGVFISSILGLAWTALAYFVVPVIVVDGEGAVGAIKKSTKILKENWGTALSGNFSLGLIGFLIMLPVFLILFLVLSSVAGTFSSFGLTAVIGVGILAIVLISAFISAADSVFKAYLYAYATGKTIPRNVDTSSFDSAFVQK
ncbi:hypothetical protein VDG1235_3837 [Verrucomicrobiia bacterium DG1235]|nr:hypothetical protein VDG1235_3837 [Verrucomicrobiae bacterium DG1235]